MKIHKLKLADKAAFEALDLTDERIKAIAIVGETGLIPNPIEYDAEGNPLPITYINGFHVDVMTTEVIQEWKDYTITKSTKWAHSFGYGEVVTAEEFL